MLQYYIYGNGITGKAVQRYLQSKGLECGVYDDNNEKTEIKLSDIKFGKDTMLFVSPGISFESQLVMQAIESGCRVTGELNYCSQFVKSPFVSITGTNGKTTVCGLLHHILNDNDKPCSLLGNGGVPLATDVDTNNIIVHESSSFQLVDCNYFCPDISVLTSLDVDHLDYHKSVENYIMAKLNNFLHQDKNAYAIFNYDDSNCVEASKMCKCNKLFYSVNNKSANIYLDGNNCVINIDNILTSKTKCNYFAKLVKHNQSNVLCAVLCAVLLGVDFTDALTSAETFQYYSHRLQIIKTIGGVTFIDDSKATNIHATLSAVNSLQGNIALIVGGYDKGYEFDSLFASLPSNVIHVEAIGNTHEKMKQASARQNYTKIDFSNSLEDATFRCYDIIKNCGGTVIMSNACSSFDNYVNYKQRGEAFKQIVEELV